MNKQIFIALCISLLLFSCKKEKDAVISYLVKTKTSTQTNNTETYFYDSENRVIKITNSNFATFTTFEYINDSVFQYQHKDAVSSNLQTKYQFNSNKLQTEKLQLSPWTLTNEEERFSYDANNFLKTYHYNVVDYGTNDTLWNNGTNFTQKNTTSFSLIGDYSSSTAYTYYTNENTIGNENFGKPFLGKSSTNILKSETQTTRNLYLNPVTTITSTVTYTYEFDNFGRVATQYATTDASTSFKNSFTYY